MILLTYPIIQNQITNQINKYNHNTTILFFNPDATSFFLLYYCGKKRTIKGDNKRKYKRNKGKGTSSQNSGRVRRIFLFVFLSPSHHCRLPRSRSIDNFFNYPFILPLFHLCHPFVLPFLQQYYPPFFISLYN